MGILKNFEGEGHENGHVDSIANIDPMINTNHYSDSSSSSDEEEVQQPVSAPEVLPSIPLTSNRTPKVKKSVSKIAKPILQVKNIGGKKSQGHRQARRHENMCFLLNLTSDLDDDFAEVNIHDLVETTVSAFAQLLLNKNKMKMWNEFIDLPEQQQERIVKMATDKKKTKKVYRKETQHRTTDHSCSSDENIETFVLIESRATITTNDLQPMDRLCRQEEAEACFHRIDGNIRYTLKSMLKRHHLPSERLNYFENDIIPYFTENPDSVYIRDLNNGFDRMLLHAVCQYLNLISKSFTRDGERYTQVENRRRIFVPPNILLSEYLKHLAGTIEH